MWVCSRSPDLSSRLRSGAHDGLMAANMSWKLAGAIIAVVLVLAGAGLLLMALTDNAMGLLKDPENELSAYLVVLFMVYGDAVIALLPGETTLNVASVSASDGELDLVLVIAAGALGAVLGDNTLYWIARSVPGLGARVKQAQEDERFTKALDLIGRHSSKLVVFCRFLPFVRWAVTAGMGALPMPYPQYLLWSTVGGVGWATYTCLMAYLIGIALDDFPLASIVISCVSSGLVVGTVFMLEKRRGAGREEPESAPTV